MRRRARRRKSKGLLLKTNDKVGTKVIRARRLIIFPRAQRAGIDKPTIRYIRAVSDTPTTAKLLSRNFIFLSLHPAPSLARLFYRLYPLYRISVSRALRFIFVSVSLASRAGSEPNVTAGQLAEIYYTELLN